MIFSNCIQKDILLQFSKVIRGDRYVALASNADPNYEKQNGGYITEWWRHCLAYYLVIFFGLLNKVHQKFILEQNFLSESCLE